MEPAGAGVRWAPCTRVCRAERTPAASCSWRTALPDALETRNRGSSRPALPVEGPCPGLRARGAGGGVGFATSVPQINLLRESPPL